jgi:hypothetical protein
VGHGHETDINNNTPEEPGQAALCLRTSARRMSSATSVVHRLKQREHYGNNLGVFVHQHYCYRMHYMWNGAFGNHNFERRFGSYDSFQAFCTLVTTRNLESMCNCVTGKEEFFDVGPGTLIDLLFDKLTICKVSLPHYATGSTVHGPQSDWNGSI